MDGARSEEEVEKGRDRPLVSESEDIHHMEGIVVFTQGTNLPAPNFHDPGVPILVSAARNMPCMAAGLDSHEGRTRKTAERDNPKPVGEKAFHMAHGKQLCGDG